MQFLYSAKFTLYEEIKQAIAYHLIALYKFHRYIQKVSLAKLIETIWNEKLKGVKLGELYIEQSPNFVSRTQKADD